MSNHPYYDGAHRVTRDGVPCRVFHKRSRELARQIAMIEIARDTGCEIHLEDAHKFNFAPVERTPEQIAGHRAPRVTPKPPKGCDYYKGGVRKVVQGVPCRFAMMPPNYTQSHWADINAPMVDWQERHDEFAEQLEFKYSEQERLAA